MRNWDPAVLAVLACPQCHASFVAPEDGDETLQCSGCRLQFPIVDGIPVLLMSDAIDPSAPKE